MADWCHIEDRFLAISERSMARLTQNLVGRNRITFRQRPHDQNTKFQQKIQDGVGPPFSKWFYRYKSAGNNPISIKFGVPT